MPRAVDVAIVKVQLDQGRPQTDVAGLPLELSCQMQLDRVGLTQRPPTLGQQARQIVILWGEQLGLLKHGQRLRVGVVQHQQPTELHVGRHLILA